MKSKNGRTKRKGATRRPLDTIEIARSPTSTTVKTLSEREDEVLAGEQAALGRAEAADLREKAADLREKILRTREEAELGVRTSEEQLREANERLVVATVKAQTMTEAAEKAAKQMSHMAEHDFLTGLPNRSLLADRLAQSIALAQRRGKKLALMYLDLDNFKHINDSL